MSDTAVIDVLRTALVQLHPEEALVTALAISRELAESTLGTLMYDCKGAAGYRKVLRLLEECGDPELISSGRFGIMKFWSEDDPEAAMAFLSGLEPTADQAEILRQILTTWCSKKDAAAAMTALAALDLPAAEEETLRGQVLRQWYHRAGWPALNWLADREGSVGSGIQADMLWEQLLNNPQTTFDWLDKRGVATAQYQAIAEAAQRAGFASRIGGVRLNNEVLEETGPAAAPDPQALEKLGQLTERWQQIDPAAAERWREATEGERKAEGGSE